MGDLISAVFGGGGDKAETVVEEAPVTETKEDQEKSKQLRSRLYSTSGGAAGQELTPDQVGRRNTLLGN